MGVLIDHELAVHEPADHYTLLDKPFRSGFFMGFLIKNLYDEKRFNIHKKWAARKIQFNSNNGPYKLYGILREIGSENKLINQLSITPPQNIGEYSSILANNKLSCVNCFLHFSPGLYPIDNNFLPTIFSDIDTDDFNNKKDILPFQRIGHIYFFAIINHNSL